MSEEVEVTAIDKRDEKRASKVWTSRAMHIAALDSSTEAGGRGGKSIESLSKNEREKRASAKRESGTGRGRRREDARTSKGQKKNGISLFLLFLFLPPRGWRKLCDR